jgi:glycosyltransferase involved in cell wall biosynthesis
MMAGLAGALPPGVTLLGAIRPAEVAAEMRRAAVLVMPSQWYESFPMVLVEAFAEGLPVVTSRLGAMAEIVEDGVTGLHAAPGDADDLGRRIAAALADPEATLAMGERARAAYLERYTPERNLAELLAIYGRAGAFGPCEPASTPVTTPVTTIVRST